MSRRGQPWVHALTAAEAQPEERAALAATSRSVLRDALVLATCRRTEVIGFGVPPAASALARLTSVAAAGRVRAFDGPEAVERVLRLATGLESAVIGEDQVLHQLRGALAARCTGRGGDVDPVLVRLVETALRVGREARGDVPRPERGLADRALAWLDERLDGLGGRRLLVAGVGPIGQAAARAGVLLGVAVTVASRDPDRAAALAERIGGVATSLDVAARSLTQVDGLVVALAGPWASLAQAGDPLPATVDLSAPTAVPPSIRQRLADRFANLDRLADGDAAPSADAAAIAAYVERAEALVDAAAADYVDWLAGRGSVATLRRLRDRAEARRRRALDRLFRRLPGLDEHERQLIGHLSVQLVASVLHEPSVRLRVDPDGRRARAARALFGLESEQ